MSSRPPRRARLSTSTPLLRTALPLALWTAGSLGAYLLLSSRNITSSPPAPPPKMAQAASLGNGTLRKVPQERLFVSEPPPDWFGNPGNEKSAKWTNGNWLKSRFHFSFAEYNTRKNANFGVLRVMNDDLVQPARGFGTHPHRDMEICTYIVRGSLTHQDNMGTKETLGKGSIQFMTAGTGVRHSEHNLDKDNDLRFIQMWLNPNRGGLAPNYGSAVGAGREALRLNKWDHMVSSVGAGDDTPVAINQDANIHVSEIEEGKSVEFPLGKGRQAYMLCMDGEVKVSGAHGEVALSAHDAAEVFGDNLLTVAAGKPSHVLVVEMEEDGRGGRTDF